MKTTNKFVRFLVACMFMLEALYKRNSPEREKVCMVKIKDDHHSLS